MSEKPCDCDEVDGYDSVCHAVNEYACTRKPDHDGPHVACGGDVNGEHPIYKTWE